MRDIASHATKMKLDVGGRAAAFDEVVVPLHRNVYVCFANDRDIHPSKFCPKVRNFLDFLLIPIYFCYFGLSNQPVMGQNRKKGRRNYKYHAITFKLSAGQYRSLRNYCKARKTTPIKLIKRNIERFISNYEYEIPQELYLTENQLELFQE